jgi:hypothetical protein
LPSFSLDKFAFCLHFPYKNLHVAFIFPGQICILPSFSLEKSPVLMVNSPLISAAQGQPYSLIPVVSMGGNQSRVRLCPNY